MKITIEEWAKRTYVGIDVSAWVLAKWRREGEIHPAPEKVMRRWMVDEKAFRVTDDSPRASLVSRIDRKAA